MHSRYSYYGFVDDLITREEFDKLVDRLDVEFGNLLSRDILEYILIDRMGRNRGYISSIRDLKPNENCTIFGKVLDKIKNVKSSSLLISDNTSSCIVNLWGHNVDTINSISEGDTIKVINGYVRDTGDGIEVNVGKWGDIEVNPEDAPYIKIGTIDGILIKKEDTKVRFRDDGEVEFYKKIWIKKDGETIPVTVWGHNVKFVNKLEKDTKIIIYNPIRRLIGNKLIVEVRGIGTITKS